MNSNIDFILNTVKELADREGKRITAGTEEERSAAINKILQEVPLDRTFLQQEIDKLGARLAAKETAVDSPIRTSAASPSVADYFKAAVQKFGELGVIAVGTVAAPQPILGFRNTESLEESLATLRVSALDNAPACLALKVTFRKGVPANVTCGDGTVRLDSLIVLVQDEPAEVLEAKIQENGDLRLKIQTRKEIVDQRERLAYEIRRDPANEDTVGISLHID